MGEFDLLMVRDIVGSTIEAAMPPTHWYRRLPFKSQSPTLLAHAPHVTKQAISAQFGCACHWLGTMTDPSRDGDAAFVVKNLQSFGVDAGAATVVASGAMPVSVYSHIHGVV
jgi:hypothetical protein